jgi:NAD(P)-dependent dehydrogenase (short-subunit alcohol dehydrogenase family)
MKNKVAMITGAAVGIGRAVAMLMAQRGAKLILLDIDEEKLELLCTQLETEVLTWVCDISDEVAVRQCVARSIERFGGIDILVNCAALWRKWNLFVEQDMTLWRKFFDINVTGAAVVTQAVLPGMLEKKWGRIIHVASVAGVYGNKKMACYSATKGAVISFVKALAKEVALDGITVNAVSPGSVSDSENGDIDFVQPSELCHMKRTGSDRENAELICFLASDAAGYISGQNIQIDGCRNKI